MGGADLSNAPALQPGDIPLPPEGAEGEAAGAVKPQRRRKPYARLDFLQPSAISAGLTLKYPFRLDGAEVRTLTARMLAVGEMRDLGITMEETGDDDVDVIYAAMVDLPVEALRGLMDEDLDMVVSACAPFLPRAMRVEPQPETGEK
ncbi:MAG: phage tail assembly protein [Rhodoblastus sp.]